MHAFLITGGTKEQRMARIAEELNNRNVSPFDRVSLKKEEGSVGAGDVRDFTKKLSLAPFGGKLLTGIIENAEAVTPEAQNALLKTLEEPSPKSILFLETVNADLLLPTITSRCQVISLGAAEQYSPDDLFQCFKTLKHMMDARPGERIKLVDAIATDREAAKAWVELAVSALHQELIRIVHTGCGIDTPPKETIRSNQIAKLLRRLLAAQKQLAANVTPKLVLDAIFLNS